LSQRKPYPSDPSDARWALIEPTLTSRRKARLDRGPPGKPLKVEFRQRLLTTQGTDAAKKIVGRKRGILTDMIGIILAETITAAGLSENALRIRLRDQAKEKYPAISKS
jgi:hypothetical protein